MLMVLLGYRILDFESNGSRVKGIQAFTAYHADGVTGQQADKLFFKDGLALPDLQPGMTLDVSFNNRGKPEKVTAVQASQKLNLGKQ